MKRVLTVSTLYPNTHRPRFGAFVARSMEALAKYTEWEVTVINPIGVPPVALGEYAELKEAAVDSVDGGVRVLRPTFPLIPKVGARINPWAIRRSVLPIAERLHAERPFDLLDAQFLFPDGPAVAGLAERLGLPFSVKARGTDVHYWGLGGHSKKAIRTTLDRAAGVLAVSQALARDMQGLALTRREIGVHYTGLDRDLFRPLDHDSMRRMIAEEFGLAMPDDEPLLLGVGALLPVKGHDLSIRALGLLERGHLALLGTGDRRDALARLAQDEGVADRVHFLGGVSHDQLPVLLSAAEVMVLPSQREGLANAWVEALACGTPIVIPNVGGAREVVRSRSAGRIVERTPEAIAQGIRAVLLDRYTRREVAETVEQFDWRAHAEALARHYDKLIAQRA